MSIHRKMLRDRKWKQQRGLCHYCGENVSKRQATLDEVVPQCRGGRATIRNTVMACRRCNEAKGSSDVGQFINSLTSCAR